MAYFCKCGNENITSECFCTDCADMYFRDEVKALLRVARAAKAAWAWDSDMSKIAELHEALKEVEDLLET